MNQLLEIPIGQLRENPIALRGVDRTNADYKSICDSVKQYGVITPISVRPAQDDQGGMMHDKDDNQLYYVIDGLQRFTASMDTNKPSVPCHIMTMEDKAVLVAQMVTNLCKVDTRPIEYSKQLLRLMGMDQTLTVNSLAEMVNQSNAWVTARLSLQRLAPTAKALVDSGEIKLSNAFALARLDEKFQDEFLLQAQTETPAEFVPKVQERKRQIDKDKRAGRDSAPAEFTPVARLRTMKELKEEHDSPTNAVKALEAAGATTLVEAWSAAMAWTLRLDKASIQDSKTKFETQKAAQSEKKEKSAAERIQQKTDAAALTLDRLKIISEHTKAGTNWAADVIAFDQKHGLIDGKKPAPPKPVKAEPVAETVTA